MIFFFFIDFLLWITVYRVFKKIIGYFCEVIATYHDDNFNKDFIIYTDKTYDEKGKLKVYYSLYEMKDNSIKLINIIENNDKKIALELLQQVLEELN